MQIACLINWFGKSEIEISVTLSTVHEKQHWPELIAFHLTQHLSPVRKISGLKMNKQEKLNNKSFFIKV